MINKSILQKNFISWGLGLELRLALACPKTTLGRSEAPCHGKRQVWHDKDPSQLKGHK